MKRGLLFIPLAVFLAMAGLFYVMLGHDPSALELARKGQPFPAFSLSDLKDPTRTRSEADLKEGPFLVNVWATWCPACRTEHAELLRLAREEGVRIVGLNYKDEREAALRWLGDLGDPYVFTIYDEAGRLGLDLGVYGAPETYVLDAEGILRYRHVGVVDERVWREVLAPMLRGERS